MTSLKKEADEILALQSIFDQKLRLLDDNPYEILIDFVLIQTSTIKYLPPFSLIINYHNEYPRQHPPSFILSYFYFKISFTESLSKS